MSLCQAAVLEAYKYIVNEGGRPDILVDAVASGIDALINHASPDGSIVLNIAMHSVKDLTIGENSISFGCTFNRVPYHIDIPYQYIRMIVDYNDRTTAMGIAGSFVFTSPSQDTTKPKNPSPVTSTGPETPRPRRQKPHLYIVK